MKKKICWFSAVVFILLASVIILSCRKKEAEPAQGFLKLMPGNTFMYLGFNDWKILRDETGAFNFLKTARQLKVGVRLKQLFEKEKEVTPQVRETARQLEALRDKVSLWDLFGGEVALAAFSLEEGRKPALVFLCRLPEGKSKLYRSYFEELLGLVTADDKQEVKSSTYRGETLRTCSFPGIQIKSRPTWCTIGDVFILSSRPEGTREIISRLKGENRRDSLIVNPDFQMAFNNFNPAEQGVIFVRPDDFIQWGRKIFQCQKHQIENRLKEKGVKEKLQTPQARWAIYYLKALVKMIGTADVVAGNFGLSGEGYWEKIRCYLDEEEGSQALLALLKSPPRQWDVLNYIPAAVPGLGTGFIELEKAYRSLLEYTTDNPDFGEIAATRWEELQTRLDFNLEKDLFPWLGSEYATCTISLSKSMTDPGSFAFLWRVKSEAGMEAALDKLTNLVREKFQASLNIVEEEYEGYKLRVVYLPLPLLPVTPTLGKVGDYLVLATRKEAFKKVVDTFRKQGKNIRQDPDFIRMQKRLGSQGTDFSFSRLEERIDAIITTLRSFSSFLGMTAALGNPQTPQEEAEQKIYLKKVNLLNDLARVLEDLKVFKFWGRISRYSGGHIEFQEFIEIERRVKE